MRDPDRIPVVLQKLEQLWRKYPDMRLSQLVVCCASTQHDLEPSRLFYVEDDVFLEGIKAFEERSK